MKTEDSSAPLSAQQHSEVGKSKRKRRRKPAADSANVSWSEEHSPLNVLSNALGALMNGDFAVRLPLDWTGMAGKVADNFNEVVMRNERTAQELAQLRLALGNTSVLLNAVYGAKARRFLSQAAAGLGRHRW
jgi:hypothetical protein